MSVLGTSGTIPVSEGANFTMVDSGLIARAVGGVKVAKYSQQVQSGNFLQFLDIPLGGDAQPAASYYELISTGAAGNEYPYPLSSVGNDWDNFSVCDSTTVDGQRNVVYAASSDNAVGYELSSCKKAHFLMVQDY